MKSKIIFFIYLFLFSMVIFPHAFMASESNKVEVLYSEKPLNINNQFVINPNTYFFGTVIDKEKINIQFGDGQISIPSEDIKKAEMPTDNISTFQSLPSNAEYKLVEIKPEAIIYPKDVTGEKKVTALEKISEYPVYKSENGKNIIYIGNVAFYLTNNGSRALVQKAGEELSVIEEDTKIADAGTEEGPTNESVNQDGIYSKGEPIAEEEESISEEEIDTNNLEKIDPVQEEEKKLEDQSSMKMTIQSVNPWDGSEAGYFKVTDTTTVYDNRGNGALRPMGQLEEGQV
ncbi:hypothetical protein, partial [Sediminibacillus terrae]|uniref:hypothetical protein n=1 Tax=Sediminibacillus terrae TaxID=1562106 RepID=UPI00129599FE